ncbi:MAG: FAD:protein FMN transferase [Granulosicoccaceae bacterium]
MSKIALSQMPDGSFVGQFEAMASMCEILVDSTDKDLATHLTTLAKTEAVRIDHKFSRYRNDNQIHKINNANGAVVSVDAELAKLLVFADTAFEASQGRFDITSGVLREAWTFDGTDNIPSPETIDRLLAQVGWDKVTWNIPELSMPAGMQIDLGGIGKEYAVDRTAAIITAETSTAVLINYGGDLIATNAPKSGQWTVGVRTNGTPDVVINIKQGAIATSGDENRFLLHNDQRYSHILDATTGWPAKNAPHSITVAAANCVQAGLLATMAMLEGEHTEAYLKEVNVMHWVQR